MPAHNQNVKKGLSQNVCVFFLEKLPKIYMYVFPKKYFFFSLLLMYIDYIADTYGLTHTSLFLSHILNVPHILRHHWKKVCLYTVNWQKIIYKRYCLWVQKNSVSFLFVSDLYKKKLLWYIQWGAHLNKFSSKWDYDLLEILKHIGMRH